MVLICFYETTGSFPECVLSLLTCIDCCIAVFLPCCMECRRSIAMRKLSVLPSVKHVNCDKTEERSVQILIPYERTFILVFWEEEWLVGGDPFYLKFWVNRPRWSKIADFQPIIAHSASAVTPSEKSSINANRKSTTRFPMSLRWSPYVTPKFPKGASKTQNGRFPLKNALRLMKVCYKVSLCENCQRQSCKAFIGLTNCAKMIGGAPSLLLENLAYTELPLCKSLIFDLFSLSRNT